MKKKTLSLLLIAAMLAALLTGCGKDSGNTSTGLDGVPNPSQNEEKNSTGITESDDIGDSNIFEEVRPNGQIDELTDAEKCYYAGVILRAAQALDTDTLSLYADDEEPLRYLELIKADSDSKEFWDKTVGQWMYFDEDGIIVSKSPVYIQAKWYTECWKNNEDITFSNYEKITLEEALSLYKTYYESSPYVLTDFYYLFINLWVENGYVKCDMDNILSPVIPSVKLSNLFNEEECFNAGSLLFGLFYNLGYDYIEETTPYYQEFMSGDVESIAKAARKMLPADEQTDYILPYLENYFESEKYRDVIQTYLRENTEILRDLDYVYFCMPKILDESVYSSRTRERLKDYEIITFVYSCHSEDANFIWEISCQLEDLGLLE